ncbi:hypothetical protein SAMN05421810_103192 [Amycolatopsis arida]|uniref:Integral membrane protein n=1 Tax=Amycolatopsis arida TaxID=587909 RepID=A0A1I5SM53_9PSEU|nr:hypothetical protein [Amycolatopsis arida]TDX96428.1 hypothetical protein CLV69_103566 [Amycolatopsis arida]SFP71798.1 hypothetical protein SAMN05421810_103192 [Amycolatopsis arida]
MDFVYDLLVLLHLLGMAGILAGVVTYFVAGSRTGLGITTYSGGLQLLTGLALVGIASADLVDTPVNNVKIAVKLVIALGVFVHALVLWRRTEIRRQGVYVVGGLAVANVVIAVLW